MELSHPKTIEYHHNIGDKVFFMQSNKIVQGEINGLTAYVYKEKGRTIVKIEYSVAYKGPATNMIANTKITSDLLFESKSKLLDSL